MEFPHVSGVALDSRLGHDERRFDRRCPGYKGPRVLMAFFFLNVNQMSTPATAPRRPRNNNNNENEPPALRHRGARGRVNVRRVNNIMMPQRLVYGNNNPRNNNWRKPGEPRAIRTLPYSLRTKLINNISLNNFKHGNIAYLMFRRGVPVLYSAASLYSLIKAGPQGRHINRANNLNLFLASVKNNKPLFRNTQMRAHVRKQGNIRKVEISANRAARVIQRKFRSTRRR
jgi:hypothetical protein